MVSRLLSLVFLLLSFLVNVSSQDGTVLESYVGEALRNNLAFKDLDLSVRAQNLKVDLAKKNWSPQANLGATYLLAEGGRRISFPVGDLFNPTYLTLNQLTNSEQFPTNLENIETQLTPNNFLDANLNITKPILNSSIKYNILIQEELLSMADLDKSQQTAAIAFQVRQAYYNFLKTTKGVKLVDQNLDLLGEVKTFNEKLIKYDKATPDVISDVNFEIQNLKSERQSLEQQQELSKILLNTLMNRDLSEDIIVDESLTLQVPDERKLAELINSAIANRQELKRLEVFTKVNEINKERIQKSNQPTLGVQGGVGLQSENFSFDDGGPLFTLALNLGWNIWDGGIKKKKLEELQLEQERTSLRRDVATQQITLEVAQAYYELQSLKSRYEAETEAIKSARISYGAVDKRYRNDRALLIELLTAQNRLLSSELNQVLLSIDMLIAQAKIKKVIHEE